MSFLVPLGLADRNLLFPFLFFSVSLYTVPLELLVL